MYYAIPSKISYDTSKTDDMGKITITPKYSFHGEVYVCDVFEHSYRIQEINSEATQKMCSSKFEKP